MYHKTTVHCSSWAILFMWRIGGKCYSQETSEVLQYFSSFQDTDRINFLFGFVCCFAK